MTSYAVRDSEEYRRAGDTDLIELLPAPGGHAIFVRKWLLEALVFAISRREFIHLSGPTGTAKSSLIEALHRAPDNFRFLAERLDLPRETLKVYPVEMATYEIPGELYQRRALKDGTTFDEPSGLVRHLVRAVESHGECPLIWLREIGRVHSAAVQGGLLNLMTKTDILLPDGTRLDGSRIGWIGDSNYQAEDEARHTLVPLDDALKRRFSVNLTLDYLPVEQEAAICRRILERETPDSRQDMLSELCEQAALLGDRIRKERGEGNLLSVPPPSIYGYLSFIRMAMRLRNADRRRVAEVTLLGNASREDRRRIPLLLQPILGGGGSASADSADEMNVL